MVFKKVVAYSKYHSLHMSGFGSAGNIFCQYLWNTRIHIFVVFLVCGNNKVHGACKAFTHFQFAFLSWLNKVLAAISFCPIGMSSVGNHCFCIILYTISFLRFYFGGRTDI